MSLLKKITALLAVLGLSIFYACSWDSGTANGGQSYPPQSSEQPSSSSSSTASDQTEEPELPNNSTSQDSSVDNTNVAVLELHFDGQTLYWTDVSAEVYKVSLNGKDHLTSQPHYEVSESYGIYTVYVDGYDNLGSPKTSFGVLEIVIKAPAPILKVENGVIVWTQLNGAIGYDVYLNETLITRQTSNSYTPLEDGKYSVSAVFADDRLNSPVSAYVAIGSQQLDSPVLKIEGDLLSWSAVGGADIYFICINGEKRYTIFAPQTSIKLSTIFLNNQSIAEDYPKGSTVTITVFAVSETALDSSPSNSVEYTV